MDECVNRLQIVQKILVFIITSLLARTGCDDIQEFQKNSK